MTRQEILTTYTIINGRISDKDSPFYRQPIFTPALWARRQYEDENPIKFYVPVHCGLRQEWPELDFLLGDILYCSVEKVGGQIIFFF